MSTRREFITLLGGAAARGRSRCGRSLSLRCCVLALSVFNPASPRFTQLSSSEWPNWAMRKGETSRSSISRQRMLTTYEKSYLELAARKVDVFLAVGNEPALRAALSAAGGAPIAFLAIDFDPLAKGYVASLSRPGGNVTGIFVRQLELAAKRVEIAREVFRDRHCCRDRIRYSFARTTRCGGRCGPQIRL